MKLLYVEDNPIDADLTRRYLQKRAPQLVIEPAANLGDAILRLQAATPQYDLVLTDLRLPDGDGIELVKYIRQRSLPIATVVITGAGDDLSVVSILKAGADDYIVKRDDYLSGLSPTLEAALHRYRTEAARRTRYLKVLYAEHNREDLDLTRRHLAQSAPHIQIEGALSGADALQHLSAGAQPFEYDVVLLDYRLPDANALELLKELRQRRKLDVPILLVTAHGGEDVALQAVRLGAAGYLTKDPGYLNKLPGELENAYYRVELLREKSALRESEERLRLAVEVGRMGAWDWNRHTDVLTWSKEVYEIMGVEPVREATYETWAKLVHPDDLKRAEEVMKAAIDSMEEYHCEIRVIRPDGALRWVEARGKPIYDESGECIRVMGASLDITDRKRAEEDLRAALEEIKKGKEKTEAENVYLREEVSGVHCAGEVVGVSERMRAIFRQVEQVAETDTTVLITGETGTGKELIARAIYTRSRRRSRPFVKVNCAALPAELMESELFGHEKGAFTGAATQRIGRFELADGGTIFLDEIGELVPVLQIKLLRVLQEGEFERVGSSKTIRVNVRVIAATNRDLSEAMCREAFRTDLYYRLAVYTIQMPPLRERKEDIPPMADAFLRETSRRLGKSFYAIPGSVLEAFQCYEWPGNVRELQNLIERAAVTSTGSKLVLPEEWNFNATAAPDLPSMLRLAEEDDDSRASLQEEGSSSTGLTLAEFERAQIVRVLDEVHWRIEGPTGAAAILGLHPNTLRSRMRKLRIQRRTISA
jgi:PAS domain S-box-containing protein